jgi:hypothetical protein
MRLTEVGLLNLNGRRCRLCCCDRFLAVGA